MQEELIPHLFRTEFRKLCSVLCKTFGIQNIEFAEDIVSDTFLEASEGWGLKGIPENPTAWLYAVAKNKAKDVFRRNATFREKIEPELIAQTTSSEEIKIDFSEQNINDAQLRMMFALSHPSIPTESQIGLSLRILCGFGIGEISEAFLSNKETINKRLHRAKEKLRLENIKMELPSQVEIPNRMSSVLRTLYLLFNEGYYSNSENKTLRKDLCLEAMQLNLMLLQNDLTKTGEANALMALMCFHASRFEARTNSNGELVLYEDQDESLWSQELIERGEHYIFQSKIRDKLTKYHLEASIAHWHSNKTDSQEKWSSILQLYNVLLQIDYSPIAALNRTYALYKTGREEEAIKEAQKLPLKKNHLYYSLLGLMLSKSDKSSALLHYQTALGLSKTESEKQLIQTKIEAL